MRMTGADAILRSLEAEGVEVAFGLPGGAILPTYDAFARGTTSCVTCSRATSRAPATWPRATRARPGESASRSPPPAPAPRTSSRRSPTPGWTRPARLHHGAGATAPDRHRRVPGVRHHRHHDPDRQALVARAGRRRVPQVLKAAFHVARTGRCGPVLVDVPRDVQEAELDFEYPDEVDLPGWKPPKRGHPRRSSSPRRRSPRREADALRGRRRAQRRRLRRAARAGRDRPAAGRHDADGEERLPRDARAALRLAGHARPEVVEPGHQQLRRARRRRRALRRPRHRQARRLRARRDRDPPRHRLGRDRKAAAGRHSRRRPAEAGPRRPRRERPPAPGGRSGARRTEPGCSSSPTGARSSRCATARTATR